MPTVTYVGAGAAATGNNATVAPAIHASTIAGDVILCVATIRNSGTGVPDIPTGYTSLALSGNVRVSGKVAVGGDAAPSQTFTGGVANADTIARTITIRGTTLAAIATAVQLNASAQNIGWPALDVTSAQNFVLMALWKQDDATSIATPGGWTSVGLTSTTTGDDALVQLYYQGQTTEADIGASSAVVTGGGAAISRGVLISFAPTAYIAVEQQDVWPPRTLITVTNLTVGDSIALYRVVAGARTLVRAASDDAVSDPAFVRVDAELPFGVPVSYVAVVNGSLEYATSSTSYVLTGGKVAISDAITGLSAEVVIMSIDPLTYNPGATVFQVGGRNVVVTGDMPGWSGTWEFYVETTAAAEQVRNLIAAATEGIVQVRQPGGYDGIDCYAGVTSVDVARFSQDGSDQRRLVRGALVQVEAWADALEARGYTLQDLADAYTGLTLQDVADDFVTLLALAQADLS